MTAEVLSSASRSSSVSVLCCGDPHFQANNAVETDLLVERFIAQVVKVKPDFVVVLGDLLHTHERCFLPAMNRAYNFLDRLRKLVPTYCLIGNHDILHNRCFLTNSHAFNPLKHWDNITIVDRPIKSVIKGETFVFCPYVPPGRLIEALSLIDVPLDQSGNEAKVVLEASGVKVVEIDDSKSVIWSKPEIPTVAAVTINLVTKQDTKSDTPNIKWKNARAIFCHQEFKNASIGILKSTEGDDWKSTYPVPISGHVHDYGHLESGVVYTGTPAQYTFGENGRKTVSLFTFECGAHFQQYTQERIDLKIPKKLTVHLEYKDVDGYIPDINNHLRIIISGTSSQLKSISKLQKLKDWAKQGIKICYKDIPDEKVEASVAAIYQACSEGKKYKFAEVLQQMCNTNGINHLYQEIFGTTNSVPPMFSLNIINPVAKGFTLNITK